MAQIFFDVYMLLAIMVMYQLMVGVVVDQVSPFRAPGSSDADGVWPFFGHGIVPSGFAGAPRCVRLK